MKIKELVKNLESKIEKNSEKINTPAVVFCNHIMCDSCLAEIEKKKEADLILQKEVEKTVELLELLKEVN